MLTVEQFELLCRKPRVEQQSGRDCQLSSSAALHAPFALVTVHVSWQPSVTGGPFTGTGVAPARLKCVLFHISISFVCI